jgi:hypothetical protein
MKNTVCVFIKLGVFCCIQSRYRIIVKTNKDIQPFFVKVYLLHFNHHSHFDLPIAVS